MNKFRELILFIYQELMYMNAYKYLMDLLHSKCFYVNEYLWKKINQNIKLNDKYFVMFATYMSD